MISPLYGQLSPLRVPTVVDVRTPVSDADAEAYLVAVEAADSQLIENSVAAAINNFVIGCKADGIWSAIKSACILAGARTLSGALVPLVGSAPTNNNFVSGDYDRETGLVGNGSSKYLNSNYAFSSAQTTNKHSAIYATSIQTSMSVGIAYLGASWTGELSDSRTQILVLQASSLKLSTRCSNTTTSTSATNNHANGLIGINRNNSNNYIQRGNNTSNTITSTSHSANEINMLIFARNTSGSFLHTNARLSFYSIGESLDLAALDSRVSTLMTDLAAAIP